MASANAKSQCSICTKITRTFTCDGCTKRFCDTDLKEHIQLFGIKFDEIENEYDQFRQRFLNEKSEFEKYPSIEEINEWEKDSIEQIKQIAEQHRQNVMKYTNKFLSQTENDLNNFGKYVKEIREENQFNECDLKKIERKLDSFKKELDESTKISVKLSSNRIIDQISLLIPLNRNSKWEQDGLIVAGGNDLGDELDQLSYPASVCVGDNQTLYIADHCNHRVIEWELGSEEGRIVAGGRGQGNALDQLNNPIDVILDENNNNLIIADRGNKRVISWSLEDDTTQGKILIKNICCRAIAIDDTGSIYVSDTEKNEVRRWKSGKTNGVVVAGGNGTGDRLDQLNFPNGIFIDDEYSLYISDSKNSRVIKWTKDAKEGIIVAGGNGVGDKLNQLSSPKGLIVDCLKQLYIADHKNNRIVRWCEGSNEGSLILGGNGGDQQPYTITSPISLSLDRENNLYVVEYEGHHILQFAIDFN